MVNLNHTVAGSFNNDLDSTDQAFDPSVSYGEHSFSTSKSYDYDSEEELNGKNIVSASSLIKGANSDPDPNAQAHDPKTTARKEALRAALVELERTAPDSVKFSAHPPRLEQAMKKDNTPKRPANAFLIYSRWRRDNLDAEGLELGPKEVSKLLGSEWKALSEKVKSYWRKQSELLRSEFDATYPWYKFSRQTKKMKKEKKLKEDILKEKMVIEMRQSALWKDTFGGKESTDRKNLEEGSVEGGSPSPPPRSKSKGRSSASKPSSSRRPREIRGKKDSDNEEEEEEEAEEEEIEDSRESSYAATRENSRPRAWRDSRFDAPSSSRPGSSASFRSLSSSSSYSQPNQHHEPANFNFPAPNQSQHHQYPSYREDLLSSSYHSLYSNTSQSQPQGPIQHRNQLFRSHSNPHSHVQSPASVHSTNPTSAYHTPTHRFEASPSSYDYSSPPTPAENYQSPSTFTDSYHSSQVQVQAQSQANHQSHQSHQSSSDGHGYMESRSSSSYPSTSLPFHVSSTAPPVPSFAFSASSPTLPVQNKLPTLVNGAVDPVEMTRHINHLVSVNDHNSNDWASEYNHYPHQLQVSTLGQQGSNSNLLGSHPYNSTNNSHSHSLAHIMNSGESA